MAENFEYRTKAKDQAEAEALCKKCHAASWKTPNGIEMGKKTAIIETISQDPDTGMWTITGTLE